jgi:tRNA A37 threonylcarbamoyladenosine synthetase subunit TsaC/SUA5/YrdC
MIHITTDILKVKQILDEELVAIPTETVYGWREIFIVKKAFKKYLKQKKTLI